MPFFWSRKHRRLAGELIKEEEEEVPLDPDAKTIIFSRKLRGCQKLKVPYRAAPSRTLKKLLSTTAGPLSTPAGPTTHRAQVLLLNLTIGIIARVLRLVYLLTFGSIIL